MLDLLLPRVCAECRVALDEGASRSFRVERVLCHTCATALVPLGPFGCALCQRESRALDHRGRCRPCSGERSRLVSCTARVEFEGFAEKWIRAFKYPEDGIAGLSPGPRAIATALACDAALLSRAPRPDLIVPVPLHANRLRARGFNPTAILSRTIAKTMACAFEPDLLFRTRDTPSQTRLGRKARRMNVRGAFACARNAAPNIWLIDDVVTTGSTLEEAARCLLGAGAKNVHGVCIARTPVR